MNETAVCSINAVRALADEAPDEIRRLFLRNDRLKEFSVLCKRLAELKRPYKICEDTEIEALCKTPHHQGIVAMITEKQIEPLTKEDLSDWASSGAAGIVLHDVGNDFNFGAIVRQAAFFDIRYVVRADVSEGVRLSTAAYRAAQGGMQHVKIRAVRSTAAFLRDAEKSLLIIGADHRARRRLRSLGGIIEEKERELMRRPSIALVVGNEEHGIPDDVKSCCAVLLRIPGTGIVESLNVAQAAALFCHEIFES